MFFGIGDVILTVSLPMTVWGTEDSEHVLRRNADILSINFDGVCRPLHVTAVCATLQLFNIL